MNVGSLYKVKQFFWLLFPTKDDAAAPTAVAAADSAATGSPGDATFWSKRYKCNVTYFSPDSYIVLLEEDGKFKKLLTSDGKLGWTWCDERYNSSFEEVKKES